MTWNSLNVSPTELRIDITLNCGQSFIWDKTGENEWTSVIKGNIISLKQCETDVLYKVRNECENITDVHNDLIDYFQLNVNLEEKYMEWCKDPIFMKETSHLKGIRVLRIDPVENLFSFICSSNNNISRISSMVKSLQREYGKKVGTVNDIDFYTFPSSTKQLDLISKGEKSLRENFKFGYRAKYIAESAAYLLEIGGMENLKTLREKSYPDCKKELLKFPGVGPKVADCICLFSLDKTNVVPVDTHVWNISKRLYGDKLLSVKTLNSTSYEKIQNVFTDRYGVYAGWAHVVLFSSDLKQFKKRKRSEEE